MRDYVLFEARQRRSHGRWSGLFRVLRNWNQRRDLRRLQAMDDFALRDIGLTREDLFRLQRLSLFVDQQWERELHDLRR